MQNPLALYRRTQRELRRQFDAFTRDNCPNCPTPCCRQPARILPTDILLAEATGWRSQLPASKDRIDFQKPEIQAEEGAALQDADAKSPDMVATIAGRVADALGTPPEADEGQALPCEFLAENGCTFPHDLRPFGCTTYLCRFMYERLDRKELTRIKRLVRELEDQHTLLLRTVRPVQWNQKDNL